MTVEQMARLVCVPIAVSLFLLAAQASGGPHVRDASFAQTALK